MPITDASSDPRAQDTPGQVISVSHVSKHFGKVAAVCDVSFQVQAGSCFALLGPNGAGKTTLMKMLYGRCRRDKDCAGQIKVLGCDPAQDELAIKALSGVVPQDNNLDDELDVTQNASAEGGSRTLTLLPGRDFESRASASSATSAITEHYGLWLGACQLPQASATAPDDEGMMGLKPSYGPLAGQPFVCHRHRVHGAVKKPFSAMKNPLAAFSSVATLCKKIVASGALVWYK